MKATRDIVHHGTLGDANRTRMSFDENSMAHLMSVLTDLYSDPTLAVIREYSLNALDSHKAANNPAPIEVTLPSILDPTFIVKDYGVGLSVDDINNNFAKYGWSSKRDTNEEVGMLGLGCKSGLTYTSQFTLVAVKGGVKTTVLVTRDPDGAGVVQTIDTCATDDPNGVEVQIPVVGHPHDFAVSAMNFFRFWEPGLVKVNGKLIDDAYGTGEDDLFLDPDVFLTNDEWVGEDYIVMGNVPYPCGNVLSTYECRYQAIVRVPIGAVNFTPSREALQQTPRTREVVQEATTFIRESVKRLGQADVDAAPTHHEALIRAERWRQVISRNWKVTYKGDEVPKQIHAKYSRDTFITWTARKLYAGDWAPAKKATQLSFADAQKALHIVGVPGKSVSSKVKQVVVDILGEKGLDRYTLVVFSKDGLCRPWLDGVVEVPYQECLDRCPKAERKVVKREKYKVLGYGGKIEYVSELEKGGEYAYVLTTEREDYDRQRLVNNFSEQIIVVDGRSVAKFKKDHPRIQHVKTVAGRKIALANKLLTPMDAWLRGNHGRWTQSAISKVDPANIDDPDLVALHKIIPASRETTALRAYGNAQNLAALFRFAPPVLPDVDHQITNQLDELVQRYAVVRNVYDSADIAEVINALWQYRNFNNSPTIVADDQHL